MVARGDQDRELRPPRCKRQAKEHADHLSSLLRISDAGIVDLPCVYTVHICLYIYIYIYIDRWIDRYIYIGILRYE